ncbi:MAG: hypothetical protein IKZ34_04180 [Alphaproteobacteria bacterium]|nr:hypothetical protein [Alphaproteobacteria bacterium]
MKNWIKKLLSDANGLPSTRLHLAWAMFFALIISLIMKASDATIGLIIGGITALAGLSVVDRKQGQNK